MTGFQPFIFACGMVLSPPNTLDEHGCFEFEYPGIFRTEEECSIWLNFEGIFGFLIWQAQLGEDLNNIEIVDTGCQFYTDDPET